MKSCTEQGCEEAFRLNEIITCNACRVCVFLSGVEEEEEDEEIARNLNQYSILHSSSIVCTCKMRKFTISMCS